MLHFEDTFTVWNTYGKSYVIETGTTKNGKEYGVICVTSSSKNKLTGKYVNDWKGQIKFYGNAFEKLKSLSLTERDKIRVKGTEQNIGADGKVSMYANYVGWEVDRVELKKEEEIPKEPTILESIDIDPDSLPF